MPEAANWYLNLDTVDGNTSAGLERLLEKNLAVPDPRKTQLQDLKEEMVTEKGQQCIAFQKLGFW